MDSKSDRVVRAEEGEIVGYSGGVEAFVTLQRFEEVGYIFLGQRGDGQVRLEAVRRVGRSWEAEGRGCLGGLGGRPRIDCGRHPDFRGYHGGGFCGGN